MQQKIADIVTTLEHNDIMTDSPSRHRLLTRSDSVRFFGSRGAMGFTYGFAFASILFVLFLLLTPPSYQFSPWLRNAFHPSRRNHFSKVSAHIFANSSSSSPPPFPSHSTNDRTGVNSRDGEVDHRLGSSSSSSQISRKEGSGLVPKHNNQEEALRRDSLQNGVHPPTAGVKSFPPMPSPNAGEKALRRDGLRSGVHPPTAEIKKPQQQESFSPKPSPNAGEEALRRDSLQSGVHPPTAGIKKPQQQESFPPKPSPNAVEGSQNVMQSEHGIESRNNNCDMYEGSWVRDDSYPLYRSGSCPHIDEPFNCFLNGRSDNMYEKFRWQPKNCNMPRLNGNDMLEILRGKRLVFIGDSLNRNMWESLVCILRNSVEDKSRLFEASGREEFRTEDSYSFIFRDYNCSIEFVRSPFLVQEWEIPGQKGSKKETLRLDLVERSCDKYKNADVLIFNTGHWWTHEKRIEGKEYYQEGDHIHGQMNVEEAFRKALFTWSQWVDANIDPKKTTVFFRGYSPSHFRGGEWNSGGQCENETEPMKNESDLSENLPMMRTIESVIKMMKTPVFYLNITKMTDFRVDAHPSMYRYTNMSEETKKYMLTHQDCSHWCLPGVPDLWNEIVYAHLLDIMKRNKGNPKT